MIGRAGIKGWNTALALTTGAGLFLQFVPATRAQYALYEVTDLGVVDTDDTSSATGINIAGEIVGNENSSPNFGFLYVGAPPPTSLNALSGGTVLQAYGINDGGQIACWAKSSTGGDHAFLYSKGGLTDLQTLGGLSSIAYGINNSGQVVGMSTTNTFSGNPDAFVSSGGNPMQDLNLLIQNNPGWRLLSARAINDSGQIVGYGTDPAGNQHAFLFYNGAVTDLGTFSGDQANAGSDAYGINGAGQVVGVASSANAQGQVTYEHAFLYTGGVMKDLQTPNIIGASSSQANGINEEGVIVGTASIGTTMHAFVYGTVMQDLNNLIPQNSGWTLTEAAAINFGGQIVGTGLNPSHQTHAFLLTPHPLLQVRPFYLQGQVNYIFYWYSNALGSFVLQGNNDLQTTNWVTVATNADFTNGYFQIAMPATNSHGFYRLALSTNQ